MTDTPPVYSPGDRVLLPAEVVRVFAGGELLVAARSVDGPHVQVVQLTTTPTDVHPASATPSPGGTALAVPASGHSVRFVMQANGWGVTHHLTCHNPPDADCRRTCHDGCESWHYASDDDHEHDQQGHELVLGDCNALYWWEQSGTFMEDYAGDGQAPATSGPIDIDWGGDSYEWRFPRRKAVTAAPASTDDLDWWQRTHRAAGRPIPEPLNPPSIHEAAVLAVLAECRRREALAVALGDYTLGVLTTEEIESVITGAGVAPPTTVRSDLTGLGAREAGLTVYPATDARSTDQDVTG